MTTRPASFRALISACISTLALCAAGPALAQDGQAGSTDNADSEADGTSNDIIVTSSRLRTGNKSEPATIITAEDIELRGIQSVDQLLRQVTSNNSSVSSSNAGGINGPTPSNRGVPIENLSGGTVVDLRGLGVGSTLVLVNGRRLAGEGIANGDFVDISGIPIEAIDRVEIVTSGASAIYGSDAVAGVVNIILKKDYVGGNIRLRAEDSSSGGDIYSVNATYGFGWGSGNLTLSGSYQDQKAVSASRFGIRTRDFRPQGGIDRRVFSSSRGVFSLPPANQEFAEPDDPFLTNVFVLPENSGGIDFDTDPDTLDVVARDSIGPGSSVEEVLPINLRPGVELYSASARLTQDIKAGIFDSLYFDAYYSRRDTKTEVGRPLLEIDGFDLSDSDFGIPFFDDFSFSGFREDLNFSVNLADAVDAGIIPNLSFDTEAETYSLAGGIILELDEDWTFDINGSFVKNEDFETEIRLTPFFVLFGLTDEETFEFIQEPFNLVRSDFTTNEDAADALRRSVERRFISGDSQLWTGQIIGRGALFTGREAGGLQLAYGGEYREEDISSSITINLADFEQDAVEIPDLAAKRRTAAGFAEASFPIVSSLTLNGALRYEEVRNEGTTVLAETSLAEFIETGEGQFDVIDDVSPFEQSDDALTWKVGLAFEPTDTLLLRATAGKSFRAPNAFEVGEPAITDFLFEDAIEDGQTGELLDPDTAFLIGGNNTLQSETAHTYNVGFVFSPDIGDHALSFDFNFFAIDYRDRIGTSNLAFTDAVNGAPLREEAIVRNADGSVRFIFIGPINVAEQSIQGIDFALSHSAQFGALSVDNRFSITRQTKNDRRRAAGDPTEDRLGVLNPMTRWNLSSTWSIGDFDVTGFLNYTGEYSTTGGDPIESFVTTDITVSYTFPPATGPLDGLRLTAGAQNVFDVDPPFFDGDNGFIAQFYDVRRRVLFIDVSKSF